MFDIATQLFESQDVRFGPIDYEKDPEIESKWTHNAEFMRLFEFEPARPMSAAIVKKQYEKLEKKIEEDKNLYHFMIRAKADDRLIGKAVIQRIEWANGNCTLRVGIGSADDWRKGYGTQALKMLLRFAFAELNMFRVSANVAEYNEGALALFKKLGFTEEVRRRQALEREGRRWDLLVFGLLKDEWLIRPRHSLMPPERRSSENRDPKLKDFPKECVMKDLFRGELVRLTSEEPEFRAKHEARWQRDTEFHRLADSDPAEMFSEKKIIGWAEKFAENGFKPERYPFSIRALEDDKLIGFMGLWLDLIHSEAWVGIGIGEREYWGKGYGTDAMKLCLQYAFMELGVQRVSLGLHEYNPRALKSYEKAGFRLEGRTRKDMLREGKRTDSFWMGILRDEWMQMQNGERQ